MVSLCHSILAIEQLCLHNPLMGLKYTQSFNGVEVYAGNLVHIIRNLMFLVIGAYMSLI